MSQSSLIFELFMLKCHEIARKYNKYPRNLKIFSKNKESLKVTKSRTYLTIMNTHKITKTHFRCIFGACDTKLNFRNNIFWYEIRIFRYTFCNLTISLSQFSKHLPHFEVTNVLQPEFYEEKTLATSATINMAHHIAWPVQWTRVRDQV